MDTTALLTVENRFKTSAYRAIKNGIKIKNVFQIVKDFKKSKTCQTCDLNGLLQY